MRALHLIFLAPLTSCALNQALNDEFDQHSTDEWRAHKVQTEAQGMFVDPPSVGESNPSVPAGSTADSTSADEDCHKSSSPSATICCEAWYDLAGYFHRADIDIVEIMKTRLPMIEAAGRDVVFALASSPDAQTVASARPWLPPRAQWDTAPPEIREAFKDCFGGPAPYTAPEP